jgi:DNA processing protein
VTSTPPSPEQLKYWLALLRTPGIGSKTFLNSLNSFPPDQLFFQSRDILSAMGLKAKGIDFIKSPDWSLIESDLSWLNHPDNNVVTIYDPLYPPQLKEINSPPPLLFVRGNKKLLTQPQISIVGSRNPSSLGRQTAIDFAQTLARHGFTITSGLALGIDAASHQGALNAGGHTIAVAGTGLDRVYPARNKDLATKIAESGAIISEFPPGTAAKANHFPR